MAQTPMVTVTPGRHSVELDNKILTLQKLKAIPGGTDLIDEKQWQNQRADNVKDIVDYSPGVFAQPRNGAESDRLSIRGSGLTRTFQGRGILVLQDDIPINTADGGFEFPVIDPWLIQYAQILRGANGISEGASNFGGAINLITPTGLTQQDTKLRAEGGSFGDKHGLISKGGSQGAFDAYATASGFSQSGFRDHNRQETTRFNGNLGWHTTPFLTQRLYLSQTVAKPEIPGAISKAAIANDSRQANINNIRGDYQRNVDLTRLAHRLAWGNGSQRFESTLYYMYRNLWNPVTTFIKEDNNDIGWRGKYTKHFQKDVLILGINTVYGTADENRTVNLAGRQGRPILNRNMNASTLETYGQVDHRLSDRLSMIAGSQFSLAQRNIDQIFPTLAHQDKSYAGANPQLGLRYDVNRQTQIFTNISRSFEPPTLDELSGGNAPGFHQLKAQHATTAEIGTRLERGTINVDAAYYYSWLNNEFVNYQFASGASDTINASRSIHEGVELGLNGLLAHDVLAGQDRFEMRNAFTWNHFRLDDDPLYHNNTLPGVPEYYLRSEISYHHPKGFFLGPNIEYTPRAYPIDLTNSVTTKPYFLYGFTATWQHPKHDFEVYVEGRNLGDRHYAATTNVVPNAAGNDGNYFYPGEGRAVYAGIKTGF